MTWEQIVLIVVVAWAVVLSYISYRLGRRVAKLEKQPPAHKHMGEDILFAAKAKQ